VTDSETRHSSLKPKFLLNSIVHPSFVLPPMKSKISIHPSLYRFTTVNMSFCPLGFCVACLHYPVYRLLFLSLVGPPLVDYPLLLLKDDDDDVLGLSSLQLP